MTDLPHLTRRDLEPDLAELYGAQRDHYLVAFHGTGTEDTLDVHGSSVHIVPVRGELELRRRLLDFGDDDRVAFLVPWGISMPIDLQGRFAKRGKVFRVRREVRLRALFGAREADPALLSSPLGEYLLQHHGSDTFGLAGGRLTVDAMWAAWLQRVWGLESGGELALDVLLGWAALDGRGALFTETLARRTATAVRAALLDHLTTKLTPAGAAVWTAWEAGRGSAVLELALVIGALGAAIRDDAAVRLWVRMTSQQLLGGEVAPEILARLGESADTALRYVEQRDGKARVRAIVLAADQRANVDELRVHLVGSGRLPSAWRARLDRLGEALTAAAVAPSVATASDAVERFRALAGHDLFPDPEQKPTVQRAEMATRLAAWLALRPDREHAATVTPYGDVDALASWYVRDGGYLDWARRWARGAGEGAFARGVAAVLTVVDQARVELDRRFARALPAWHQAGRPATQVIPIDQAIKRIAAAFLDEDADRRLLVVLMDGMAWAQATELLASMGQRVSVWGPLAWHGMAGHRIGDAPFPPVLTHFPTVTEVSRAAFFAGKSMPPGPSPSTHDDPKRWAANREVVKLAAATETPRLLLRGDVQNRDGSLSEPALSLVRDPGRRLAAVVINAIDMSLKADAAQHQSWAVDTVKLLPDLLDAAAAAGRAVLLCSDHGHVPIDRLEAEGRAVSEGARWRAWPVPTDPCAEHEVALVAGDGVWAPRGAHGVVVIADDAHRYGGGAGSGEHGGASLAEVVAPCLLIGNADTRGAADDRGQAVRPVRAPRWWHFDLGAAPSAAAPVGDSPERERRPRKGSKPAVEAQLPLAGVAPPRPPEPPAPTPPRPSAFGALAASALLQARAPRAADRDRVVLAVEFLGARNGVADAAAFATELGEFAARVGGLVSRLQEILNVDGYQVLRYDRVARQVHLDLQKLAQQFEIAL